LGTPQRQTIGITWTPLPASKVKLNVDKSSLGNLGPSGFGILIHDSHGSWLVGFLGYC